MPNTCPREAAMNAIYAHVKLCEDCRHKWAGLRENESYCDAYLTLTKDVQRASCTCGKWDGVFHA